MSIILKNAICVKFYNIKINLDFAFLVKFFLINVICALRSALTGRPRNAKICLATLRTGDNEQIFSTNCRVQQR